MWLAVRIRVNEAVGLSWERRCLHQKRLELNPSVELSATIGYSIIDRPVRGFAFGAFELRSLYAVAFQPVDYDFGATQRQFATVGRTALILIGKAHYLNAEVRAFQ